MTGPGEDHALRDQLLATLVLTVASLALWGNALEEMAKFLPAIHRLADPGLYPGDAEVDSLLQQLTWGLRPLVWFERAGALHAGLFVLTLLARAALAAAAWWLAGPLARDRWERLGAAALIVMAHPTWGVAGFFRWTGAEPTASHLAVPFGVVALGLALRGRPLGAGAWIGLGANLHPMAMAACVPLLVGAIAAGASGARERLRAVITLLLASVVAALPVIVWTLLYAVTDVKEMDPAEAKRVVLFSIPGHMLWSASPPAVRRGLLALLPLVALLWPRERGEAGRRLAGALGAGLAAFVGYVLLAESGLAPLLLLKAHCLRVSMWLSALGRLVLGLALVDAARRGQPLGALGAGLLLVGCTDEPGLQALAALALAADRWQRGELPGRVALGLGGLPLALLAGEPWGGLWGPLLRALVLAALVLGGVAAARRLQAPRRWPLALVGAALAWVTLRAVVVPGALGVALPRLTWRPDELLPSATGVRLAEWAAEATPRDARFLVHPRETAFLALSRRSMVVSSAITTLTVWDVRRGAERLRLHAELGVPWGSQDPACVAAYQVWPAARVLELARRHGASYVVIERLPGATVLPWPVARADERYVVYGRPPG